MGEGEGEERGEVRVADERRRREETAAERAVTECRWFGEVDGAGFRRRERQSVDEFNEDCAAKR